MPRTCADSTGVQGLICISPIMQQNIEMNKMDTRPWVRTTTTPRRTITRMLHLRVPSSPMRTFQRPIANDGSRWDIWTTHTLYTTVTTAWPCHGRSSQVPLSSFPNLESRIKELPRLALLPCLPSLSLEWPIVTTCIPHLVDKPCCAKMACRSNEQFSGLPVPKRVAKAK